MATISKDIIDRVRETTDIVDIISDYVDLKQKGPNLFGLCPFHNEKTPSFSVAQQKQIYYCFGCHLGGNVFSFLMEYLKKVFLFQELLGIHKLLFLQINVSIRAIQKLHWVLVHPYLQTLEKLLNIIIILLPPCLMFIKINHHINF